MKKRYCDISRLLMNRSGKKQKNRFKNTILKCSGVNITILNLLQQKFLRVAAEIRLFPTESAW
jgi:hypothetical protein